MSPSKIAHAAFAFSCMFFRVLVFTLVMVLSITCQFFVRLYCQRLNFHRSAMCRKHDASAKCQVLYELFQRPTIQLDNCACRMHVELFLANQNKFSYEFRFTLLMLLWLLLLLMIFQKIWNKKKKKHTFSSSKVSWNSTQSIKQVLFSFHENHFKRFDKSSSSIPIYTFYSY